MSEYPSFQIATPFGPAKLTISYAEKDTASYYEGEEKRTAPVPPRRNVRLELGAGKVNRLPFGRVDFSLWIQDWTGEGGQIRDGYTSLRVYDERDNSINLTSNAHSKVREALETALRAFLATPEYRKAVADANTLQKAQNAASVDAHISTLQEHISTLQRLKEELAADKLTAHDGAAKVEETWGKIRRWL